MKLNRLFEIVYLLLVKERLTATELAQRFEVSTRTIYRDVDALSMAGIPIYMSKGKGGGISLLPNFVFDKSVLTEEEKTDVMSALHAMRVLQPGEEGESLSKISSFFGEEETEWLEVDFSSWANGEKEERVFRDLRKAILQHRVVQFTYSSAKGEQRKRSVKPLKLLFKGYAWYLYGYCMMREQMRFFKISRIEELVITLQEHTMTCPGKVLVETDYHKKKMIHTVMKVSKKMAFRVFDEFAPDMYEADERGDFICRLEMPDIQSICGYAFSFGGDCEVMEPESAKMEMRKQVKTLKEKYQ